jgi:CheY-like chemotaxis protein
MSGPSPRTVLVVDDEEAFLLSLVDGLRAFSDRFRVLIARNGREALHVVRLIQIDLVVTDLRMPDMDGYELLEELRETRPNVPTLVMTALGTPDVQARLQPYGPLRCLEKPLDIDQVAAAIVDSLGSPRRPEVVVTAAPPVSV